MGFRATGAKRKFVKIRPCKLCLEMFEDGVFCINCQIPHKYVCHNCHLDKNRKSIVTTMKLLSIIVIIVMVIIFILMIQKTANIINTLNNTTHIDYIATKYQIVEHSKVYTYNHTDNKTMITLHVLTNGTITQIS